jgi:hypothetical protein
MLNDNDLYVVFKLTSGENVMAVLRQEDEQHVLVEHPMIMRSIINVEIGKESLTAQPLCVFTNETDFVIAKKNIMFMKKLHHVFIPHFKRIVNEHEESTLFVPNGSEEPLPWENDMTPEKARKAIEQLENIFGTDEEEESISDKLKRLVPGNDTIN